MSKAHYQEGQWFAVPLLDGGYTIGIVARASPKGVLARYFFGPRRDILPALADVSELTADDAVLVGRFGYLGLKQGAWPALGSLDGWRRDEWPMPVLFRQERMTAEYCVWSTTPMIRTSGFVTKQRPRGVKPHTRTA